MKKIFRLIRGLLVFIVWTMLFTFLSNLLINLVWHFNFMSAHSWDILSVFWNQGGVIKTTSDILLIAALCLLPVLWLTGFLFALKLNYVGIFTKFISLFYRRKNIEPERIVLKNIKPTRQLVEDIKNEIESLKPDKAKKAGSIRSEIKQKLTREIKTN